MDNATIHQGYPAFLGVSVQDTSAGATVAGAVSGAPAAEAGISAGDVITSVGGTAIASAADLSSTMGAYHAGDQVTVTWTGVDGSTADRDRHPRDRPRRLRPGQPRPNSGH